MTEPASAPATLFFERIAAALFGLVLLAHLGGATGWNRLFDTAFLVAAIVRVARPGPGRGAMPWLSLYLWLDAAIQLVLSLCFPSALVLVTAALTGLYGAALVQRLRARGIAPEALAWRAAARGGPAPVALALLALLYLPMLPFHRADPMWTGPLVVTVGQATTMNAGHMIDLGTDVVLRGMQAPFGRGVALLLAAIAVAPLARLGGRLEADRSRRATRVAAAAAALWWLGVAHGYHTAVGLLFGAGVGWLCFLCFVRPDPQPPAGNSA